MHYDECWASLHEVDLLLCSTASPRPVVTLDRVRPAVGGRRDRPLCILDIAVPRDVEPNVGTLDNVFLYDLDDLRAVVEQLSRSLMNKFLHEPTVRLRAAAANGRGLGIVDAVRYLFGLDDATRTEKERDRDHHQDLQ